MLYIYFLVFVAIVSFGTVLVVANCVVQCIAFNKEITQIYWNGFSFDSFFALIISSRKHTVIKIGSIFPCNNLCDFLSMWFAIETIAVYHSSDKMNYACFFFVSSPCSSSSSTTKQNEKNDINNFWCSCKFHLSCFFLYSLVNCILVLLGAISKQSQLNNKCLEENHLSTN